MTDFKESMSFIAIVAIVAVVGLVVLIMGSGKGNQMPATVVMQQPALQMGDDEAMSGQGWGLPALPRRAIGIWAYNYTCHGGYKNSTGHLGCRSPNQHTAETERHCQIYAPPTGKVGVNSRSVYGNKCLYIV